MNMVLSICTQCEVDSLNHSFNDLILRQISKCWQTEEQTNDHGWTDRSLDIINT